MRGFATTTARFALRVGFGDARGFGGRPRLAQREGLRGARIGSCLIVRLFVGIERNGARNHFHATNRRSAACNLSAERVVIGELAMIRLRVRVSRGADSLEIGFRERRFVLGQRSLKWCRSL